MIRLCDNQKFILLEVSENQYKDIKNIANQSISDLVQNSNLLIFPHSLDSLHGNIQNDVILFLNDCIKTDENKLEINLLTNNIIGFIGRNDTQITITSRFAEKDINDYFLHYMLQKTMGINLFNFEQTKSHENIWNFLYYLFPYYLKRAYSQGIFKAYQKNQYNDANVKGTIDIKRHIKMNIPFQGKIAYNNSEHSYNNFLTQLIRHTIEFINSHPFASYILKNDSELNSIVQQFRFITEKTYNLNERNKIIIKNLKPVQHPYYTEYKPLQKLCIEILQNKGLTFGQEKDKIYGILFDIAWLWEKYLKTILPKSFIHCDNLTKKNVQYLFESNKQPIYPDFLDLKNKIVTDAKYMPLDNKGEYSEDSEKALSIYYKTITYMYRFQSNRAFLLYPTKESEIQRKDLKIKDTNGTLIKLGLPIPQEAIDFQEFIEKIKKNEIEYIEELKNSN